MTKDYESRGPGRNAVDRIYIIGLMIAMINLSANEHWGGIGIVKAVIFPVVSGVTRRKTISAGWRVK